MSGAASDALAIKRTLALRKVYSQSLYAVDCLRIAIANSPVPVLGMSDCMETLADMQEAITAVFPGDKTLGD